MSRSIGKELGMMLATIFQSYIQTKNAKVNQPSSCNLINPSTKRASHRTGSCQSNLHQSYKLIIIQARHKLRWTRYTSNENAACRVGIGKSCKNICRVSSISCRLFHFSDNTERNSVSRTGIVEVLCFCCCFCSVFGGGIEFLKSRNLK